MLDDGYNEIVEVVWTTFSVSGIAGVVGLPVNRDFSTFMFGTLTFW